MCHIAHCRHTTRIELLCNLHKDAFLGHVLAAPERYVQPDKSAPVTRLQLWQGQWWFCNFIKQKRICSKVQVITLKGKQHKLPKSSASEYHLELNDTVSGWLKFSGAGVSMSRIDLLYIRNVQEMYPVKIAKIACFFTSHGSYVHIFRGSQWRPVQRSVSCMLILKQSLRSLPLRINGKSLQSLESVQKGVSTATEPPFPSVPLRLSLFISLPFWEWCVSVSCPHSRTFIQSLT